MRRTKKNDPSLIPGPPVKRAHRRFLLVAAVIGFMALSLQAQVARVSIKRVLDANGNTPWSDGEVLCWMDLAGEIFADARMPGLKLIEIENVADPGGWYLVGPHATLAQQVVEMEEFARVNPSRMLWRTSAINVYLVGGIDGEGGLCSLPTGSASEIILIAPRIADKSVGLAHEFGHYFNLRHTFDSNEGIADTPADPWDSRLTAHQNINTRLIPAYGDGTPAFNTLRYNVMSYYGPILPSETILTPGQSDRARSAARNERQHVTEDVSGLSDRWRFGDFNGDGRDDRLRYVPGLSGAVVYLSDGRGRFNYRGSWASAGWGSEGWYVGDFNGDGRDDIFRFMPGNCGAEVLLSTGTSFVSSGCWTGAGSGSQGWLVGDFNGDNRDDLMRYLPGTCGAQVLLSTGASFVDSGCWTGAGSGSQGWQVGDFNGDGRDDIFRLLTGSCGAQVLLSNGAGFVDSGCWTSAGSGAHRWYVGDFNGDGRDDLFRYQPDICGAEVLLSTGAVFASTGCWTISGVADRWHVGDFNADGRDDIFRFAASWSPTTHASSGSSFDRVLSSSEGSLTSFGLGCPGETGRMLHQATGEPRIGESVTYTLSRGGPRNGTAFLAVGLSRTSFGGFSLPLDLAVFNAPGCRAYVSHAAIGTMLTSSAGMSSALLLIPPEPCLVGTTFYSQFLAIDPTANPLGLTTSNGIETRIGW